MPQHKTSVEEGLRATIPVTHKRQVAFLPIAEARAGESLWRTCGIFFVNGELRIEGRRVNVVIAVLIVQREEVAKHAAGISQTFQPFPTARLFWWWQFV